MINSFCFLCVFKGNGIWSSTSCCNKFPSSRSSTDLSGDPKVPILGDFCRNYGHFNYSHSGTSVWSIQQMCSKKNDFIRQQQKIAYSNTLYSFWIYIHQDAQTLKNYRLQDICNQTLCKHTANTDGTLFSTIYWYDMRIQDLFLYRSAPM